MYNPYYPQPYPQPQQPKLSIGKIIGIIVVVIILLIVVLFAYISNKISDISGQWTNKGPLYTYKNDKVVGVQNATFNVSINDYGTAIQFGTIVLLNVNNRSPNLDASAPDTVDSNFTHTLTSSDGINLEYTRFDGNKNGILMNFTKVVK
jgi:hypothetical protein